MGNPAFSRGGDGRPSRTTDTQIWSRWDNALIQIGRFGIPCELSEEQGQNSLYAPRFPLSVMMVSSSDRCLIESLCSVRNQASWEATPRITQNHNLGCSAPSGARRHHQNLVATTYSKITKSSRSSLCMHGSNSLSSLSRTAV